jgi:hypothetical protein
MMYLKTSYFTVSQSSPPCLADSTGVYPAHISICAPPPPNSRPWSSDRSVFVFLTHCLRHVIQNGPTVRHSRVSNRLLPQALRNSQTAGTNTHTCSVFRLLHTVNILSCNYDKHKLPPTQLSLNKWRGFRRNHLSHRVNRSYKIQPLPDTVTNRYGWKNL